MSKNSIVRLAQACAFGGGVVALVALQFAHRAAKPPAQTGTNSSLIQGQILPAAKQTEVVLGDSILWTGLLPNATRLELMRSFERVSSSSTSLRNVYTGQPSEVEGHLRLRISSNSAPTPVVVWQSQKFPNVVQTLVTACYDGQSLYLVWKWDNVPSMSGFSPVPTSSPVWLAQIQGVPRSQLETPANWKQVTPKFSLRRLNSAYTESSARGEHILVDGVWSLAPTPGKLSLRLNYERGDSIEIQGRDKTWNLTKPFKPNGYIWEEKVVYPLDKGQTPLRFGRWKPTAAEAAKQQKAQERKRWMDDYRSWREVYGLSKEKAIEAIRFHSRIKDWTPLAEAWDTPDLKPTKPWLTPTPKPTPTALPSAPTVPVPPHVPPSPAP